jgi:hypothetical protein
MAGVEWSPSMSTMAMLDTRMHSLQSKSLLSTPTQISSSMCMLIQQYLSLAMAILYFEVLVFCVR